MQPYPRDPRTRSGGDDPLAGELTSLLAELIAIPSPFPPGESTRIAAYAAARLERAGYAVETACRVPGVENVVARIGSGRPSVVFNAHVDTVSVGERSNWHSDPYEAVIRDGQVVGLGAGNCKGSMAVQLWLAEEVARRGGPARGELVFTFVADEENLGPNGMRYLREAGLVRPDILILGAQTENQLVVAERGVLWARITTSGRAAHAGDPSAGDNAVLRMVRIVAELDRRLMPLLAERREGPLRSTMNVGMFHGGHNTNVVPSACVVEIDRRLLPSESVEAAFAELRAVVDGVGEPADRYNVELLTGTEGFAMPAEGPGVAAFQAEIQARTDRPARFLTATGVSDGRYFATDGIEIINFGPGSGAQGHAANESVPIDQMAAAARIQLGVVQRLLGLKQ